MDAIPRFSPSMTYAGDLSDDIEPVPLKINSVTNRIADIYDAYCLELTEHNFECDVDEAMDMAQYCSTDETEYDCVDKFVVKFITQQNLFYFWIYFALACPMVIVALVFNSIALASVLNLTNKLSRHFILFAMSISDTLLSLVALMRRIDQTLLDRLAQTVLIGVWQFTWLLSAFCLLALALDMFVCLTKPYHYTRPFVKEVALVGLSCMAVLVAVTVIVLGILDLQEHDYSQYFACGLVVVIISFMCASHIYACVSAELLQSKANRSKARQNVGNNRRFLRKSVITTTLLILSSLLSWIPLLIFFMIPGDITEQNVPFWNFKVLTICLVFFHTNAVFNPLIYSFRFRDVRSSMKRLFWKNCTCCPESFRETYFKDSRVKKDSIILRAQSNKLQQREPVSTQPAGESDCNEKSAMPEQQMLLEDNDDKEKAEIASSPVEVDCN